MSGIVTIVVHGTFATQEKWWRLGTGETFADRLEQGLAQQGMPNTVWHPILRAGLSYDHFAWSGENTHHARMVAGRKLAQSLDDLAQRLSASPDSPLSVNVVAHSHGGNVALEAIRHLGKAVHIRRFVCMGTPLLSFRPALRLVRPFTVSFLTLFASMFAFLPFLVIPILLRYAQGMPPGSQEREQLLGALFLPVFIPMFGWMLLGLNKLVDLAWSLVCWSWLWLVGKTNGQVYGPSPQTLAASFGKQRVLFLTSHFDEADLFLELSAAPATLYNEFAESRYTGWRSLVERFIFRPAVVGLLLHPAELVLERFVLGLSWFRLLFFDYNTTSVRERGAYPRTVFDQVDLTQELQLEQQLIQQQSPPTLTFSPFGHTCSLRHRVTAVGQALAEQVRLRHAMYYQNTHVLGLVTTFITRS
ncbi:MAG: hypothetical protein NTNFB02_28510 [Nitrospira sp.]